MSSIGGRARARHVGFVLASFAALAAGSLACSKAAPTLEQSKTSTNGTPAAPPVMEPAATTTPAAALAMDEHHAANEESKGDPHLARQKTKSAPKDFGAPLAAASAIRMNPGQTSAGPGAGAMSTATASPIQAPMPRGAAEVAPPTSAQAPLRARLDPNARYATTYRPGGAMLAAFDAAVARGALPAAYRDLVADFGGRYAPEVEAPRDQALAFRVETERSAVAPSGGFLHLRVAMRSSDESPGRSPLSVHLVLDVSGSMAGAALANAKSAAQSLVDRLQPSDMVSITTFSNDAKVIVPAGAVGPRRDLIKTRIVQIVPEGGTNISAGLDMGYAEARRSQDAENATKIVMLLSDGMANGGDTTPLGIARRSATALTDGVQTSTFGLGDSFDAAVMSTVADRGAGGYYYLKDPSQIAGALATELDARLQPVAQAVEVRVRLKPDVTPVRIYGSRELGADEAQAVRSQEVTIDRNVAVKTGIAQDRKQDAEGGMRFFMPAVARADRHAMLLELQLPPGVGERTIGSVEVRYKDTIRKRNVTQEIAIRTGYAESDAASAKTINASVVATMQAFSAGDAILRASDLSSAGNRAAASTMLRERAELLKRASSSLAEPRLTEDATRIAKLASIVGGETTIDPVPLAILLRGSAYGYLR